MGKLVLDERNAPVSHKNESGFNHLGAPKTGKKTGRV
jgi:hypothetical protein